MTNPITAKEAYNIIKNKYSNMEIFSVIEFDSNHFLFGLKENENPNTVYYSINKNTGVIKYFFPMENFDKFSDAIVNNSIDIENLE